MAGENRYLNRDATTGRLRELLAAQVSTGPTDANRIVALAADGKLDPSLLPASVANVVTVVEANEELEPGEFVYVFDDAGTPKTALAVAGVGGNPALGYVLDHWYAADMAVVFLSGLDSALSGLTPGQRVYLSDTVPGAPKTTPVTGAGKLHQFLGRAVSATELNFDPDDEIELAA